MLKDFKEQIASKQIDFKKQIVINSVVYVIKVTISYESHNFSVTIYPNIDKNLSDPNEFDNISQYLFKREILNEVQFIEMLQEVGLLSPRSSSSTRFRRSTPYTRSAPSMS